MDISKNFISEERILNRKLREMGVHEDTIDELTTDQKRSYVNKPVAKANDGGITGWMPE